MSESNASYPGAIPPPPGVTANLDAPTPSSQKAWLGSMIVITTVPTLLVLARLYTRCWISKKWTWCDTCFIFGWAFGASVWGLGFSFLYFGIGQYAWNLSSVTYSKFIELDNIQQILYLISIGFIKTCLLLQLIEIFIPLRKGTRFRIVWALIIFNIIYTIVFTFIEIFQCWPREKIWNPNVSGKCINNTVIFIITGAINPVQDFAILALPLLWISKLNMTLKCKLKLGSIFAAGLFACACSVVRLVLSITESSNTDYTVSLLPVFLWAAAEIASGLVVACLPYIPKLVETLHPLDVKRLRSSFVPERLRKHTRRSSRHQTNCVIRDPSECKTENDEDSESETGITQTFQVHQYTTSRNDS